MLTSFLIINHIFLLLLIFTQNDISKKTTLSNTFSAETLPETLTWMSLALEFCFLFLKLKINY